MKQIFVQGPSLQLRLLLLVLLSALFVFTDRWMHGFDSVRLYLNSLVSPVQYLASAPTNLLRWGSEEFNTRARLQAENQQLKSKLLGLSERLQRQTFLEQENAKLRQLLGSPLRQGARKMVGEVMAVDSNPFSLELLIDKGAVGGVYEGQPVIDAQGIIGQVVNVGPTTSRVLLISDATHAIPVRVARNGIRSVAAGTGQLDELSLTHVPHRSDIRPGDLLLSSGLGGRFPEGYPVARVTSVISDEGKPFAQVLAKPIAELDRIRYLLLIWAQNAPSAPQDGDPEEAQPQQAQPQEGEAQQAPLPGSQPQDQPQTLPASQPQQPLESHP